MKSFYEFYKLISEQPTQPMQQQQAMPPGQQQPLTPPGQQAMPQQATSGQQQQGMGVQNLPPEFQQFKGMIADLLKHPTTAKPTENLLNAIKERSKQPQAGQPQPQAGLPASPAGATMAGS